MRWAWWCGVCSDVVFAAIWTRQTPSLSITSRTHNRVSGVIVRYMNRAQRHVDAAKVGEEGCGDGEGCSAIAAGLCFKSGWTILAKSI